MSLNCREIDAILKEIPLVGSQIQKITMASWDRLALHLYGKNGALTLLIVLSAGATRLHLTKSRLPKSKKPLRFAELLSSRIRSGYIETAVQLGDERIVRIDIRRGEFHYILYIRLWSNAANILLCEEDGLIIDALKRSPRRGEISGKYFNPEEALQTSVEASTEASTEAPQGGPTKISKKQFSIRDIPGTGTFNERVDAFYSDEPREKNLDDLQERLSSLWGKKKNKEATTIASLEEKRKSFISFEKWRHYGDLLMAHIGQVEIEKSADGDENHVKVRDYLSEEVLYIEVDTSKNLIENAEDYYTRHRKAKTAIKVLEDEIAEISARLKNLIEEEQRLLAIEDPLVLERELAKNKTKEKPQIQEKKHAGLSFLSGEWTLLLGRSAKEYDELLRRSVRGNDYWLHVRDYSGSYVFIKSKAGKTVPLEVLLDAGNLALFYSKARKNGNADLYYTQVKYLKRVKGGPLGLVLPTQEKNLHIELDQSRIKRLLA